MQYRCITARQGKVYGRQTHCPRTFSNKDLWHAPARKPQRPCLYLGRRLAPCGVSATGRGSGKVSRESEASIFGCLSLFTVCLDPWPERSMLEYQHRERGAMLQSHARVKDACEPRFERVLGQRQLGRIRWTGMWHLSVILRYSCTDLEIALQYMVNSLNLVWVTVPPAGLSWNV